MKYTQMSRAERIRDLFDRLFPQNFVIHINGILCMREIMWRLKGRRAADGGNATSLREYHAIHNSGSMHH